MTISPSALPALFIASLLCAGALPAMAQAPAATQTNIAASPASTGAAPASKKPSTDASATKAPAEPDTLILSDTLHYDDVSKTSTFTGNVVLTRGAMTLRSEKLVTHEDAKGNQFGTATAAAGQLVNIRQENPEKFETLVATGQKAEYDGQNSTVTLIGQATVTRLICGEAFDNVRGARIVYHEKTSTYEAFGGADSAAAGGRVRSLAQPQSRIDQAIAKCKATHR